MNIIGIIIGAIIVIIAYLFDLLTDNTMEITGGDSNNGQILNKVPSQIDNSTNKLTNELSRPLTGPSKEAFKQIFPQIYGSDAILPPIITIDDIKYRVPYQDNKTFRTQLHIGQRKLFLSELQFFTEYAIPNEPTICVYAGAAPSNHTGFLAALFPQIKFLLVDPNKFDVHDAKPIFLWKKGGVMTPEIAEECVDNMINGDSQIYIINDYFTMDIARAISKYVGKGTGSNKCYFISDIRTNFKTNESPGDIDIVWNMSQMYNWVNEIKPAMSMLKFRQTFGTDNRDEFIAASQRSPYVEDFELSKSIGIDFVADYLSGFLRYYDGKIYIQAWAPLSSTESRLVTDGKSIKNYGDKSEYEDKFFYFNRIERPFGIHFNDNANADLGFDHCADCSLENHIWKEYLNKYQHVRKKYNSVLGNVAELSRITSGRALISGQHGKLFSKYPVNTFLRMIKNAKS